jgi:hypothetical protein
MEDDIITQLKKRKDILENNNSNTDKKINAEWIEHGKKYNNVVSHASIVMNERKKSMEQTVGWKCKDGKKIYTTFRNKKLVQCEGFEGYKLALGDEKNKPKKRKITNIENKEPVKNKVLKLKKK